MINKIHKYINESSEVLKSLSKHAPIIEKISKQILICHKNKGKILVCGNGGSQADADHFVGELVCTYSKRNRKPISAISLSQPIAALTAWSNDFKYNTLLQRQVKAHGKKNDILFLISTGGGSKKNKTSLNLVYAAEEAKKKGMKVISLIGKTGGILKKISNNSLIVESFKTSYIQESHIVILHLICEFLEDKL